VSAAFFTLPGTTSYGGIICVAGILPLAVVPTPTDVSLKETKYFLFTGGKDTQVWTEDTFNTL